MLLYCLSHLQTTEESIKRAVNKKPKVSQPQLKPNPKRIANPAFEPLSIRLRTQTAGEAPPKGGRYACLANPCFRLAAATAFSLRYACSNFLLSLDACLLGFATIAKNRLC